MVPSAGEGHIEDAAAGNRRPEDVRAYGKVQNPVVGHRPGAQGIGVGGNQRAAVNDRAAGVTVAGREGQGAGAGLGQATAAADAARECGARVVAARRQRCGAERDVAARTAAAGERTDRLVEAVEVEDSAGRVGQRDGREITEGLAARSGSGLKHARADVRRPGVGVRAGKGQSACAGFRQVQGA